MSSIVVAGDTSGTITLDAPAVAGTTVLTLPTTNGTVLASNSATTLNSGASAMTLQTAGTTAVTIDTSQNVGIGTASPNYKLTFGGQTGATATPLAIRFSNDFSNGTTAASSKIFLYNDGVAGAIFGIGVGQSADVQYHAGSTGASNGNHRWYTNDTERMRIASDGIVTGTAGNLMLVHQPVVTLSSTSTTLTTTIPTWAKRVTLVCNGAIQNSTASLLIRLNSITTGYSSLSAVTNTGAAIVTSTAGFILYGTQSTFGFTGSMTLHNQTGNTWVQSHSGGALTFSPPTGVYGGGSIALAAALSTISVTTTTGTATLSGSISVLYE